MKIKGRYSYHTCSFSPDGGSLGLALAKSGGEIVHFTLNREIGSANQDRILFMGSSLMTAGQEGQWLPVLRKILERTNFPSDPEKDIVEEFVELMESRVNLKAELIQLLSKLADHFRSRGFVEWAREASESATKIGNDEMSVIEGLWLRYSPTGDVDQLFVTEYKPEDEEQINTLNDQLASIINPLFQALDKALRVEGAGSDPRVAS